MKNKGEYGLFINELWSINDNLKKWYTFLRCLIFVYIFWFMFSYVFLFLVGLIYSVNLFFLWTFDALILLNNVLWIMNVIYYKLIHRH